MIGKGLAPKLRNQGNLRITSKEMNDEDDALKMISRINITLKNEPASALPKASHRSPMH